MELEGLLLAEAGFLGGYVGGFAELIPAQWVGGWPEERVQLVLNVLRQGIETLDELDEDLCAVFDRFFREELLGKTRVTEDREDLEA